MVRRQNPFLRSFKYVVVGVFLLIQVYPVAWVLMSSLKTPEELAATAAYAPPGGIYFGNYVRAFGQADLGRYLLNSTIVAVATLTLIVVVASPAAYAIAKLHMKGRRVVLGYFLLGVTVPVFVSLLPMFQVFNALGLRNTYASLIIPQLGFSLPIAIYLYVSFMRQIPSSLIEAAKMDGAGLFRIFTTIVLPMSANTTVTIVAYNFVFIWNEFVFANTFSSGSMKTLPVGLNDYVGILGTTDFGATYAAIVVAIVPTLFLYFILNRRILEGMAAGAVRG